MVDIIKEHYGDTFQRLRESKELKQSAFESLGLSRRTILNFEKGEKMLEIDKLDAALAEMNTSLAEFEYLANDFSLDDYEDTFLELEHAYYNGNVKALQEIEDFYGDKDKQIALCAKAAYSALTEKEKKLLADYIMGVDIWGFYELCILSFIAEQLSTNMLQSIMKDWIRPTTAYQNIFKYRRKMQQVLHRIAAEMCTRGEQEFALKCLVQSRRLLFERDTFSRTLHYFVRGYYQWTFKDKEAGDGMMKEAIHVFEITESNDLLKTYQDYYDKHVKNDS
ncbi:MAG: hypothetical protein LBI43_01225 [Streptococcaceae bacterium]|jgi:Rgg/GadR/MutR family transcriptional activator|nr:hypothetical protein [Streptococcaceae bacterium]